MEIITYLFPSELLKRAEEITLAQLLDTPCTQPWIVSAISNATLHSAAFDDNRADTQKLDLAMNRLLRDIEPAERMALFRLCNSPHQSRKKTLEN